MIVSRFFAIFGLCLIELVTVPASFAQTGDRRLEAALAEIALLKRTVADQGRRITALESALNSPRVSNRQGPTAQAGSALSAVEGEKKAEPAWFDSSAWKRIKNGMSYDQVVAILGKPTKVESLSPNYQTVFYQGSVRRGVASVTGTIVLSDDQVIVVRIPAFE